MHIKLDIRQPAPLTSPKPAVTEPNYPSKKLYPNLPVPLSYLKLCLLEAGYGSAADIRKELKASKQIRQQLNSVLTARWNLLLPVLESVSGTPHKWKPAWKFLETSEKVAPSFLLGSAAAYIAIIHGLPQTHPGRKVRRIYHSRIYANPSSCKAPVNLIFNGKKRPDYIVLDNLGGLHILEAKGLSQGTVWKAAATGMEQAMNISAVGFVLPPPPPVSYNVAVTISTMSCVKTLLVDPPGEEAPSGDRHGNLPLNQTGLDLVFFAAVCDTFDALGKEDAEVRKTRAEGRWLATKVLPEIGLTVGIDFWLWTKRSLIEHFVTANQVTFETLEGTSGFVEPDQARQDDAGSDADDTFDQIPPLQDLANERSGSSRLIRRLNSYLAAKGARLAWETDPPTQSGDDSRWFFCEGGILWAKELQ